MNDGKDINRRETSDMKRTFSDLINSIKYMFQSAKGKYSLESYLEVIGEFTDDTIVEAEKEGLNFFGGECSIKSNILNNEEVSIAVNMQFRSDTGEWKKKEATRFIEKSIFTDEAIKQIGGNEGLTFAINPPVKR